MRTSLILLALAAALAFAVARFGRDALPQSVQGDDVLSVAFADAKRDISLAMVRKADSYFHGGIDMDCHEAHDHEHDAHEHDAHGHEPGKEPPEEANAAAHADPWRWINSHVRAPERHVHLDGRKAVELIPWFWASVKANPHNIDAWTTAWYVANNVMGDRALAQRILAEAKAKNPESLEIAWTEARFAYDGGKGDAAATERILESARLLGKRLCGGRLADLSPHDAEVYCYVLDYLSKLYEQRGAKASIPALLGEAQATGITSPVIDWIRKRAKAD